MHYNKTSNYCISMGNNSQLLPAKHEFISYPEFFSLQRSDIHSKVYCPLAMLKQQNFIFSLTHKEEHRSTSQQSVMYGLRLFEIKATIRDFILDNCQLVWTIVDLCPLQRPTMPSVTCSSVHIFITQFAICTVIMLMLIVKDQAALKAILSTPNLTRRHAKRWSKVHGSIIQHQVIVHHSV